jgi:hypothetical protein
MVKNLSAAPHPLRYGARMSRMKGKLKIVCIVFMTALTGPALASLGGDDASVHRDGDRDGARIRTTPTVSYDVEELTSDSGLTVREYLTRSGKVFAITWQGPVLPDLPALLAEYFPRYKDALQQVSQPATRGHARVEQQDLVVESDGHMRAFTGRAYLPGLVPPGVSIDALP